MRVAIVSPAIEISGGIKQLILLSEALRRNGMTVDFVAPNPEHAGALGFLLRTVSPQMALARAPYDVAVMSWFTTHELASRLAPLVIHFCQGYEGSLPHLKDSLGAIEGVYKQQIPTLTVSSHLALMLQKHFNRRAVVLAPLLDPHFYSRWRIRPHRPARIIVHGIYESAVKRVDLALQAITSLRMMMPARLCRISAWPQSTAEPRCADAFHSGLSSRDVANVTAAADLTLFTSDTAEGFGLPVLESLAAGIPVVCARIPSLSAFEQTGAVEAVEAEPRALAAAMAQMLQPAVWREARTRGHEFVKLWRRGQNRRAALQFQKTLALYPGRLSARSITAGPNAAAGISQRIHS